MDMMNVLQPSITGYVKYAYELNEKSDRRIPDLKKCCITKRAVKEYRQ
jgi:hypothetical protein